MIGPSYSPFLRLKDEVSTVSLRGLCTAVRLNSGTLITSPNSDPATTQMRIIESAHLPAVPPFLYHAILNAKRAAWTPSTTLRCSVTTRTHHPGCKQYKVASVRRDRKSTRLNSSH